MGTFLSSDASILFSGILVFRLQSEAVLIFFDFTNVVLLASRYPDSCVSDVLMRVVRGGDVRGIILLFN